MKNRKINEDKSDDKLTCYVSKEELIIRIGIETLSFAAESKNGGILPVGVLVSDSLDLARSVRDTVTKENEVGESLLTSFLDNAISEAYRHGTECFYNE